MSSSIVHVVILGLVWLNVANCDDQCTYTNIYNENTVKTVANQKYPGFVAAELLDPLSGDNQTDKFYYKSVIEYDLINPVLMHLKECTVTKASYNETLSINTYIFKCPHLTITSKYKIESHGTDKHIHRSGTGKLTTGEVVIVIETPFTLLKLNVSETYLRFGDPEIEVEPTDDVTLKLTSKLTSYRNQTNEIVDDLNQNDQELLKELAMSVITEFMNTFSDGIKDYFEFHSLESVYCDNN